MSKYAKICNKKFNISTIGPMTHIYTLVCCKIETKNKICNDYGDKIILTMWTNINSSIYVLYYNR